MTLLTAIKTFITFVLSFALWNPAAAQTLLPSSPLSDRQRRALNIPLHSPLRMQQQPYVSSEVKALIAPDSALKEMIRMIQSAEREVVMSYFTIWPCAINSKIIFDEIKKRKDYLQQHNKNLSVKIIFDPISYSNVLGLWLSSFHLGDAIAHIADHGFEIKLYNPRQQINRSHVKIFAVDGQEAISGSRNLEDISFGLNPYFNLTEVDLHVRGAAAKQVTDFFYLQWNSDNVLPPRGSINMFDINGNTQRTRNNLKKCFADLNSKNNFDDLRSKISRASNPKSYRCSQVKFVADLPNHYLKHRNLVPQLIDLMREAQSSIQFVNYTFVPIDLMDTGLKELAKRPNIKIEYLTNAELDDVPGDLSILAHRRIEEYGKNHNFKFYSVLGEDPAYDWIDMHRTLKVLHSKIFLVDEKSVAVTSLNMDPLSISMNAESGIFVKDCPDLVSEFNADFRRLKEGAQLMNPGSDYHQRFQDRRLQQPTALRIFREAMAELKKRLL